MSLEYSRNKNKNSRGKDKEDGSWDTEKRQVAGRRRISIKREKNIMY